MPRSGAWPDSALKGHLSIHKTESNVPERHNMVRLEVEDEISSTRAIEIELPLEAFALALFGRGYTDCTFKINRITPGLKYQHEQRTVFVPHEDDRYTGYDEDRRKAHIRRVLSKYETDGWNARDSDAMNMHRAAGVSTKKGQNYHVHFYRWVYPDGSPLIESPDPELEPSEPLDAQPADALLQSAEA